MRARLKDLEPNNRLLQEIKTPDYSPTREDLDELSAEVHNAQERSGEPSATAWELGWGARGMELERIRLNGQRILPPNYPTIDDFRYGVAVSIKTIDLNAPWYRNATNLSARIDQYVNKLFNFQGIQSDRFGVEKDTIKYKTLDIVIPINSGTPNREK